MRRALAFGGCALAASFLLSVAGAGAADPHAAGIDVSPTSHGFGALCAGRASAPATFTIKNTATPGGNDLQINSISRVGDTDFSNTEPSRSTIPPNQTATFKVTFTPNARGSRAATFTVYSNAQNGNFPVDVSGSGIDRRLSADRSPVSFGNQRVGTRSPAQALILQNHGGDTVTVGAISRHGTNGADFIVSAPAVPFKIGPGGARTVTIAFQPSGAGARSGSVEFSSNACATPSFRVTLLGTGVVSNVVVQPNPIDAGTAPVGKPGVPVPVTISNDGGAALTISAVQVLGVNAVDFELTGLPPMPLSIPPKGSSTFNVRMTPRRVGPRSATLTILSDAPDTPNFIVALSGIGTPAASPGATPTRRPTSRSSPSSTPAPTVSSPARKLGGSAGDSLAVGLVVGGCLAAFTALLVIRGLVGGRDDD